jgi:hypothetical protein
MPRTIARPRDLQQLETAERSRVYAAIAEELADIAAVPVGPADLAVRYLCGETDDERPLTICAAIQARLVRILVTYRVARRRPADRIIEILHGPDRYGVRARTIVSTIGWDELPSDIRRRVLTTDQETVHYRLYPRETPSGRDERATAGPVAGPHSWAQR